MTILISVVDEKQYYDLAYVLLDKSKEVKVQLGKNIFPFPLNPKKR